MNYVDKIVLTKTHTQASKPLDQKCKQNHKSVKLPRLKLDQKCKQNHKSVKLPRLKLPTNWVHGGF